MRPPFKFGVKVFELSHLDSFDLDYIVPEKNQRPEQRYKIRVDFSAHCFTKEFVCGEGYSSEYSFVERGETRLFNEERYELSKQLPKILKSIGSRSCFHAHSGNFVLIEKVTSQGESAPYHVFFKVSKSAGKAFLILYVSSAYIPDRAPDPRAKPRKPIAFSVIAYNIMTGKPIKQPS